MITLTLDNNQATTLSNNVLQFAVPFAQSTLYSINDLGVLQNNNPIPTDIKVTAYWPDASVRWIVVTVFVDNVDLASDHFVFSTQTKKNASEYAVIITEHDDFLLIKYNKLQHRICKKSANISTYNGDNANFGLNDHNDAPTPAWVSSFDLSLQDQHLIKPAIKNITISKSLFPSVTLTGHWQQHPKLNFALHLHFYPKGLIAAEFVIHNSGRAQHPNGLWDLGDPGSFFFKSLQLRINGIAEHWQLQAEKESEVLRNTSSTIGIQQHSSGGENWQSVNHVNARGIVPFSTRGYTLNIDKQEDSGLRAEPIASASNQLHVALAIPKFWQQFPQAIELSKNGIELAIFAPLANDLHELQGGEKSSREIWLQFSSTVEKTEQNKESLRWVYQKPRIIVPKEYYVQTACMPWLSMSTEDPLASCILPPDNFFAKREIIDEYGWRNFGDIFADHETLYQPENEDPYISHYNNQYDAIYGFCRQYLITGDTKWFELMDDLAKHVTNIDIYDTEDDREEYNHGLFWHTDHYLPAETATHRTYSKLNNENGRSTAGGGPGPEHCYTTGLCYHYWLTGNEASKQAVLKLADWITVYHEGSNCFFSQLLVIKNNHLPRLVDLLKGKMVLPHSYAFTRGTGNYITALLDAYELSANKRYLEQAEHVIKHCIHPADDITQRQLDNVEVSWSYLILLSSLMRYLNVKAKYQQYDDHFAYAKASVIHYALWICKHEKPFLSEPDKLDYPNSTWTAQDIRKSMLLFQSAGISNDPKERNHFLESAQKWLSNTLIELQACETLSFARIQVILMQNHGSHLEKDKNTDNFELKTPAFNNLDKSTLLKELKKVLIAFAKSVTLLKLTKELKWLKKRM